MANPEHLKILEQGVEVWNQWREENLNIIPDLRRAKLTGMNLSKMNFSRAGFSRADLRKTYCGDTDFSKSNFSMVNLSEANLGRANLYRTNLCEAILQGSLIRGAYLIDTDLSKSLLLNVDLQYSNLVKTNLSKANITGSKLYATSRDDWNIEGVKCDYVYWDKDGEIKSPKDRDFAPGEFEQLYKTLPIIEYVFQNGMLPIDPLIMDRVVQAIRENKPEFDLKIDSINARGVAPSIKFTVQQEEHKEPALQEITREYETKLQCISEERDRYYQLISQALDAPREMKLINAAPGSIVATDGSTINIEQHIQYVNELQKAIAQEPKESKSFLKIAKDKALDIVGGALEDIAKGKVKEAAKDIYELGKLVGPLIAQTAAYAYFKGLMGM